MQRFSDYEQSDAEDCRSCHNGHTSWLTDLFLRGTWGCSNESRGGHKDVQRSGAPPLGGQAEKAELVQHGEEEGDLGHQGDIRTPSSAEGGLQEC